MGWVRIKWLGCWCRRLIKLPLFPTLTCPVQNNNSTDCGAQYEYADEESYAEAEHENCGRAAAVATDGGAAVSHADSGTAVAAADGPAAAVSATKPGQATAVAVAGSGGSARSAAGL